MAATAAAPLNTGAVRTFVRDLLKDLFTFAKEQALEFISFFIVFVLRLLLQVYDLLFHRAERIAHRQPSLSREELIKRPFTEEELRPVADTVDRERIHDDFYGWFRNQIFCLPLECGKTVIARKRACRHIGKTRGALLLVHGFSQNRYAWHVPGRSLANYLAEAGYDVFFVDLRGSRESVKLGAPPARGVQEFVEIDMLQALRLISRVGEHKRVTLLGHSLGGAVSCATASAHPQYIEGVVHIAGLYGFRHHTTITWKALFMFVSLLQRFFPHTPRSLVLPTRELGLLLRASQLLTKGWVGRVSPIQPYLANSTEAEILTEYLQWSFEGATLGVMQGITALAEGKPFCDENGRDYLARFAELELPLLVICADRDDLVNVKDSLLCFESSVSTDKEKIVFASDDDHGESRQLAFGHCDILIGSLAVNHVWEKLRIWLDERKKLQVQVREPMPITLADVEEATPHDLDDQALLKKMKRSASLPSIVAMAM